MEVFLLWKQRIPLRHHESPIFPVLSHTELAVLELIYQVGFWIILILFKHSILKINDFAQKEFTPKQAILLIGSKPTRISNNVFLMLFNLNLAG